MARELFPLSQRLDEHNVSVLTNINTKLDYHVNMFKLTFSEQLFSKH